LEGVSQGEYLPAADGSALSRTTAYGASLPPRLRGDRSLLLFVLLVVPNNHVPVLLNTVLRPGVLGARVPKPILVSGNAHRNLYFAQI